MRRSARFWASACASVLVTTKSTPSRLDRIMLLTALPPAPPTPTTVMRGRSSGSVGLGTLSAIAMLPYLRSFISWARSEILFEPQSHAAEEPRGRRGFAAPAADRLAGRQKGVHEQAGAGRERRSGDRVGEAVDAHGFAHAHLLVEDQGGEIAHAGELRGAAGQHDPTPREIVEAARLQTRADELEGLLDARLDYAGEDRLRHRVRVRMVFLADQRHVDHLALVGRRGERAAV